MTLLKEWRLLLKAFYVAREQLRLFPHSDFCTFGFCDFRFCFAPLPPRFSFSSFIPSVRPSEDRCAAGSSTDPVLLADALHFCFGALSVLFCGCCWKSFCILLILPFHFCSEVTSMFLAKRTGGRTDGRALRFTSLSEFSGQTPLRFIQRCDWTISAAVSSSVRPIQ